jgi:hypothetical protein
VEDHSDQDLDGDGYIDDAYGWNFDKNTPNIAGPNNSSDTVIDYGHGKFVTEKALDVFTEAGSVADNIKIMYVIDTGMEQLHHGSAALNYILYQKQHGVNIIAVAEPQSWTDRLGAEDLESNGILSFTSGMGNNKDMDDMAALPSVDPNYHPTDISQAFYNATPRLEIQEAPVTGGEGNDIITGIYAVDNFEAVFWTAMRTGMALSICLTLTRLPATSVTRGATVRKVILIMMRSWIRPILI